MPTKDIKPADFTILTLNDSMRVALRKFNREDKHHPSPNFQNTGLALSGIMRKNESINQYIKRRY